MTILYEDTDYDKAIDELGKYGILRKTALYEDTDDEYETKTIVGEHIMDEYFK